MCVAQAPTHLATDLLEHTGRVFLDGYPSNISLEELPVAIERYQLAEIRSAQPMLGWIVNSNQPNTLQTAYQILVATSRELLSKDKADLWDSGRTESDNSVAVPYSGKPLKPSVIYYWRVKTWDNHGTESPFSQVKSFITAEELDGSTARYPLQVSDELPVKIQPLGEKHSFIDFGRASFGRLKLTLSSDRETDTVIVRLGECAKDGQVNRHPGATIRYAEYRLPLMPGTHTYTLKIRPDKRNTDTDPASNGIGVRAVLMPDYTGEVMPFRYCEVEGYSLLPLRGRAGGEVVRQTVTYPFDDTASAFHSSDTVLNQIWELCKYSVKALSFPGMFVDGDRERIPYEGDIIVGQPTRYAVDRRYEFTRYSLEYLIFSPTWPTEWAMQEVLMIWADYLYSGNPASLQKYYEEWKMKTLAGLTEMNGLISTRTGKLTPEFFRSIHYKGKNFRDIVDWPVRESDGYVFTDYNTVVNAYHYQALRLMSEIAGALGKTKEQTQFAKDAGRVKERINQLMLDPKTGLYRDGIGTDHSSLHANVYPLAYGIAPEKNRRKILDFIRSHGMAGSVYTAQALLDAIYKTPDADSGLQLLSSTGDRSWYNMIRVGSTISLEAWDNKYKPNQDWNHIWGAAAGNIIARKLMGIEPLESGFKKIRIKPQPATLQHAEIKVPSVRGDIRVAFDNQPNEQFSLEVEIPANSIGEIQLPKLSAKYKLTVDNTVQKGTIEGDFVKVDIGSGKHRFVIEK
ncbi:MAG: alpha-L-rhamnosidase [Bacteroidales bacterium]|nr:alpha-L-rhamnosidase [Bacteroidales bacterium]